MNKKYPAYVVDAYIKSLGRDGMCYSSELRDFALTHYGLPKADYYMEDEDVGTFIKLRWDYQRSNTKKSFSEWVFDTYPDEYSKLFDTAPVTVGTTKTYPMTTAVRAEFASAKPIATIFDQDYRYPEAVFDGYADELEQAGLDWSHIGLVNYGVNLGYGAEFGNYYMNSDYALSACWYLYDDLPKPKPKFSEWLQDNYPNTYNRLINGNALSRRAYEMLTEDTPLTQTISGTELSELQGVLKVGDVIRAVPGTDTSWLKGEEEVERIDGAFFWLKGDSYRYWFGGGGVVEIINKPKTMSNDKFYKVTKDTFLWKAGAIIKSTDGRNYQAINSVWDVRIDSNPSLEARVVENSPEWFERVFEVNTLTKIAYMVQEKASEFYTKHFQE